MVVLITGASGGLGTSVVRAFLDSGAAAVFGVARTWRSRPTEDGRFHPIEADLNRSEECRRVAESARPLDALVHLVGGFAGGQPVAETSDEQWQEMLAANLNSAFGMIRAVLPAMIESKRGRIVAVGSKAALDPMPRFAAYSVSKAALLALVKAVAGEVGEHGITANVVLPSIIDTAANRAAMPRADFSKWVTPESIANLLVWLTSDKAADINGAAIPIYGRS